MKEISKNKKKFRIMFQRKQFHDFFQISLAVALNNFIHLVKFK